MQLQWMSMGLGILKGLKAENSILYFLYIYIIYSAQCELFVLLDILSNDVSNKPIDPYCKCITVNIFLLF